MHPDTITGIHPYSQYYDLSGFNHQLELVLAVCPGVHLVRRW